MGIGVALINVLFIGGLFAAGGLSLLLYGRSLNRKPAPAPGWLSAKGKVTRVEVTSFPKPGIGLVGYAPFMEYDYDVRGIMYKSGNTVSGPNLGTDPVSAKALADRYPAGTPVTVHYNPKDPREAAVEVNPDRGGFYVKAGVGLLAFALLLSCGMLAFGLLMDGLVLFSIAR